MVGPQEKVGLPFGRRVEDLFSHSWRPEPTSRLVWIRKPGVMGCEEFPARFDEVRLWGSRARRVVRVPPPPPLPRSFVSAVREGEMR